jgi:hypothetical protein
MLKFVAVRMAPILMPAVLLAACVTINVPRVTPGAYPNYREMLVAQLVLLPYGAPRDLVHKLSVCGADALLDNLTPNEAERLDKYARGEVKISDSELEDIDSDLRKRIGGGDGLERQMRDKCPEVVEEADAYKKAHEG